MWMVGGNALCFCGQPPRVLLDGYAVCRCPQFVYVPSGPGPMTPWSTWTATSAPELRAQLVQRAKARIGHLDDTARADPANVRAAAEAARLVDDNVLANDLEYEQWVASL